ncbi:MAG: sulfatase-like hydrolase/transferase [Deltaproteobacteria bacterium]|nr:sulfatase-like hydrolase/transferase [Deltaproteobacteria bacterium]
MTPKGKGIDRRELLELGLASAAVMAGCKTESDTLDGSGADRDPKLEAGTDASTGRDADETVADSGAPFEDASEPDSGDPPPPAHPNLVFIFADQLSFDMIGASGNAQAITPAVDQLAGEGVRFRHCVSIAPVCTPYRGMLLSGQHPLNNGAFTNDIQMLPTAGTGFAEVLRDSGYRMGYVGKWHLYGGYRLRPVPAGPFRYGNDATFLTNNVQSDFRPQSAFYYDERGARRYFGDWEPYGQTAQIEDFLDQQSSAAPFALFVSWHPPHYHTGGSYLAPTDLMALYDRAALRLRPTTPDTPENRRDVHGYYALTTMVDRCLKRVVDKLREKGLERDTIVVFTSDHGDLLNVHGFTGSKARPEDESARVPLIVRWPRTLEARVSDLLMGTLDLMPSILGLMGLDVPATCQGSNLATAILDQNDEAQDALPMFMYRPERSWRGLYTRQYTYACEHPRDPAALNPFDVLYDRVLDPTQEMNLFNDPGSASLKDQLHGRALDLMARYSDDFAVTYEALMQCLVRPALPLDDPDATGALRGRPIDLLRDAGIIR